VIHLPFISLNHFSASDSTYSYTFLHSVVCLSVCLSSVTFVHHA